MVKQIIIDMQKELTNATQNYGKAKASERLAEKKYLEAKKVSENWESKAKMALSQGNADLAKQALAKKVKADPTLGINYENQAWTEEHFGYKEEHAKKMTGKDKLILVLFFLTFVIMVVGVVKLDWWFEQMAVLFLVSGVIMGIIGGMNERKICEVFIGGASDLVGVALVCGLARAVNMLLTSGQVSDTILYAMSGWVEGMSPILFAVAVMIMFLVLGFFIASTSGLAILAIPIIAPLADTVGLPREIVISGYLFGQGLINLITPTNTILPVLQMTNITYDKYLKWVMPLFGLYAALGVVMLVAETMTC